MKKALLFISICLLTLNTQATIRYVTPSGTTSAENAADATSWETACNDLQAVINASSSYPVSDTIFVAAGIYKPVRQADYYNTNDITPNNRNNVFMLKFQSIRIFGSFEGWESSPEERQLPVSGDYTSILSGDFNGNDGTNFSGMNENAYNVLVLDEGTTTIDGFTITGGNANGDKETVVNGTRINRSNGGGIQIHRFGIFINVKVCGNVAAGGGGGIYNAGSNPSFTNVIISGNKAGSYGGGGMFNHLANPTLTNVIISDNISQGSGVYSPLGRGGGMYNNGLPGGDSPIMTNVIICRNTVGDAGGGVYNLNCSPRMTNVTISGNTADIGGGMYNITAGNDPTYSSTPKIRNSIIWGNTSGNVYNCINEAGFPETDIFVPVYSYSLVEGEELTPNGVILNGDPLFDNDFNLMEGSPCINAGSNLFFTVGQTPDLSAITDDLAGNMRIFGNTIDLGAYEYQQEPIVSSINTFFNNEVKIYTQNHSIIIENTTEAVNIYSISGQLVAQGAGAGSYAVPSAGVYIVRAGSEVRKVIVP